MNFISPIFLLTKRKPKKDKIMKLNKIEEVIKERLYDISWINNLESDNLVETIKMIKEKGFESELKHEINIGCDETLVLLDRISFRNHLQRRYKVIVETEQNQNDLIK
jgi:hypothetical protein